MNFISNGRRTSRFFVKEYWGRIGMSFLESLFSGISGMAKKATNVVGITKSSGPAPPANLPPPPPAPPAGGGRRKKGRRGVSRKNRAKKNRRGSRRNRQ